MPAGIAVPIPLPAPSTPRPGASLFSTATSTLSGVDTILYSAQRVGLEPREWIVPVVAPRTRPKRAQRNTPERTARLGERVIRSLPSGLLANHAGEFLAVTLAGDILALNPSIDEVMAVLRGRPPAVDYYLARIGRRSVAELL